MNLTNKVLVGCLVLLLSMSQLLAADDAPTQIEQAAAATLKISTELIHGFTMDRTATERMHGAGFLVDRERGWIVTNAHVSGYGHSRVRGQFLDQSHYVPLERLFVDSFHDVAILRIDPENIPAEARVLELECDYRLNRGEPVFSIGHPNSQDFTAAKGILSGRLNLHVDGNFYTTDLIVEGGNSGGPVVRLATGKVIAMATSTFQDSGIGQLTRARDICRILEPMRRGENPARPRLGFQPLIVDGQFSQWVGNVIEVDSPLQFMDEIISWDGKPWDPRQDGDLADLMRGYSRADVELVVRRDGAPHTLTLPISPGISEHEREWVFFSGITLTQSPFADAQQIMPAGTEGVVIVQSLDRNYDDVMDVEFGAYAVIISMDGQRVGDLRQAHTLLKSAAADNRQVHVVARAFDYNAEALYYYFQHSITVEDLASRFNH